MQEPRRNKGGMTHAHSLADTTQHHRSVSDGADEWEYPDCSVRDMASFGLLSSRLALIVIVSKDGRLRAKASQRQGR